MEMTDTVAETALVLQLQLYAHTDGQKARAASHRDGRDERMVLDDEPGLDRVGSEIWAAH